jgi:hypothetical protein
MINYALSQETDLSTGLILLHHPVCIYEKKGGGMPGNNTDQ